MSIDQFMEQFCDPCIYIPTDDYEDGRYLLAEDVLTSAFHFAEKKDFKSSDALVKLALSTFQERGGCPSCINSVKVMLKKDTIDYDSLSDEEAALMFPGLHQYAQKHIGKIVQEMIKECTSDELLKFLEVMQSATISGGNLIDSNGDRIGNFRYQHQDDFEVDSINDELLQELFCGSGVAENGEFIQRAGLKEEARDIAESILRGIRQKELSKLTDNRNIKTSDSQCLETIPEEQIVGIWKWHTLTYNFRSDGTYDYENSSSGFRTSGRYAIEGDEIIFIINSPVKIKFSFQNDNLKLYHEDEKWLIYSREQKPSHHVQFRNDKK